MIKTFKRSLPAVSAWIFWLLPLAGLPLAFGRLTGGKVPLFGMVQGIGFTGLGLIALAVLLVNIPAFAAILRNSLSLRLTALGSAAVMLTALIQQWLYGGSVDHLGTALFYAATPLAAAAIAPQLKKTLPKAACLIALLLLYSGIVSGNFTGITGNWNWNQTLFFAFLPAFFIRFKNSAGIKYILLSFFLFIAAGSLFYPEELSLSLTAALPLCCLGLLLWRKFPRRFRLPSALILFAALILAVFAAGLWCTVSDSRIQLFASTAELLKHHGVIGVGPGRFFDFIQEFITPEYFHAPFSALHHPHPHNELLHLWSAYGIAGIFFIGTLFCGVLVKIPVRRNLPLRTLLPIWIFLLIFVCAQSDLTGSIITGGFWMLAAAGCAMAPRCVEKTPAVSPILKLAAAALVVTAVCVTITDFRVTLLLRKGRLALQQNQVSAALKYYQESIAVKPTRDALYGCAEIALHGFNDYRSALYFLQLLHDELAFDNYLHTNRMKAVALVNLRQAPAALEFIKKDLRAYPVSIINHRLYIDLLRLLKAPQAEIEAASQKYAAVCYLRGLTPEQGKTVAMFTDDQPLPQNSGKQRKLDYPELFPGVLHELAAAFTLFAAALGFGALCCRRQRRTAAVELAVGIIVCSICGALLPAKQLPVLMILAAAAGIYANWERVRHHWKMIALFGVLSLPLLANALLPPNGYDEQIYLTALLKRYAVHGFMQPFADNPFSAAPSLAHAFLLCGFDWGGATLPRLMCWIFYLFCALYLYRTFAGYGKFSAGAVTAALFLSPLALLLLRNFHTEVFVLLFAIAGAAVLLKSRCPENGECFVAGLMAGGAAAVQISGGSAAAALLILLLFRRCTLRSIALFISGVIAAAALFYLRSWYAHGNPFYPYASAFFGGTETALMVERFHRALAYNGSSTSWQAVIRGWLFSAVKPWEYDGVSTGFQFPLFFIAALAGTAMAVKYDLLRRRIWIGIGLALICGYLFWALTIHRTFLLCWVMAGAAFAALCSLALFSAVWKRLLGVLAIAAAVITLMNSSGIIPHCYFSWRILADARQVPAGFAAVNEKDYIRLLHQINALPENSRIALLSERRTLYMPRETTVLMPWFQEKLTPVPECAQELFKQLSGFDYLVVHISETHSGLLTEYDYEVKRLHTLLRELVQQNKLVEVPDSQMMILRVATSAAGTAR